MSVPQNVPRSASPFPILTTRNNTERNSEVEGDLNLNHLFSLSTDTLPTNSLSRTSSSTRSSSLSLLSGNAFQWLSLLEEENRRLREQNRALMKENIILETKTSTLKYVLEYLT